MFWDNLLVPSSNIKKSKGKNRAQLKLTDTVFFLGLCLLSRFLKRYDVLEAAYVSVFI